MVTEPELPAAWLDSLRQGDLVLVHVNELDTTAQRAAAREWLTTLPAGTWGIIYPDKAPVLVLGSGRVSITTIEDQDDLKTLDNCSPKRFVHVMWPKPTEETT
jgi:hypothetical protein